MADTTSTLTEAAQAASVASGSLCADTLPLLQTFLVPLLILATAIAAWLVQRAVLARRAAFDYIANHELRDEWEHLAATALSHLAARDTKDAWATIATDWSQGTLSQDDLDHIKPILRWLNRREFVSIGLLNGSIHQPTYADWWEFRSSASGNVPRPSSKPCDPPTTATKASSPSSTNSQPPRSSATCPAGQQPTRSTPTRDPEPLIAPSRTGSPPRDGPLVGAARLATPSAPVPRRRPAGRLQ